MKKSLNLLFMSILLTGFAIGVQASGSIIDFKEFQSILTKSAHDWEHFVVDGDHYLAIANTRNDSTNNVDSVIYKWNGTNFVSFQTFATNAATKWEYFNIAGNHYLALANHNNDTTNNIDSKIFVWNGTNFVETQTINTNGAFDWEYFTIGSDHYLALANYFNDTTLNIDSKIYKWNGTNFVEYQSIPTRGAIDWEYFSIGSDHYLAVAHHIQDGGLRNIDSKIYKWNSTTFDEIQAIATNGAIDWEYFTINGVHYLMVANHDNNSTVVLNSVLYQWNGTNFVTAQNILTNGAFDLEFFTSNNEYYLAIAHHSNNSTDNVDSKIYKWDGTNFVEFQSIPTHGATNWEYFSIGTDEYLAVANDSNDTTRVIDSIIYKADKPQPNPPSQPDPPKTDSDDDDDDRDDPTPPSQPAASADQVFDCWPWEVIVSPLAVPGAGNQCLSSLGEPLPASSNFAHLGHSTDVSVTDAAGMAINQFNPPLKICFRYTQAELAMVEGEPAHFLIQTYHNGAWEQLTTTPERDPSPSVLGRVCAPVDHLTLFALFDGRDSVQSTEEALGSLDGVRFLPETGLRPITSWLGLIGGLFIGIVMWMFLSKRYQ